jgi:hypothetical protein
MKRPTRYALALAGLLLIASCGSESEEPPPKAEPSTSATPRADVEVLDPVLVRNDNGGATLSAKIVNHTHDVVEFSDAYFEDTRPDGPQLRIIPTGAFDVAADGKATLGHEAPAAVRIANSPGAGAVVAFTLEFSNESADWYSIPLRVPVVARTSAYADVTDSKIITSITVEDARIVVVPGQHKAYVNGTVVSTIEDIAYELPTARDDDGKPVPYRHQTATGGPYGFMAEKSKKVEIGLGPTYKEFTGGDADYVNAKDVTVGETITVTIPFQSGDVIVPFKVVAG